MRSTLVQKAFVFCLAALRDRQALNTVTTSPRKSELAWQQRRAAPSPGNRHPGTWLYIQTLPFRSTVALGKIDSHKMRIPSSLPSGLLFSSF